MNLARKSLTILFSPPLQKFFWLRRLCLSGISPLQIWQPYHRAKVSKLRHDKSFSKDRLKASMKRYIKSYFYLFRRNSHRVDLDDASAAKSFI